MSGRSGLRYRSLVDLEQGTVDRSIFVDDDVYRMELERIFARAWNFMCHESQIPQPGDFFLNSIGEDRVIIARDRHGEPQVLLNTCRHRGNAVCRAKSGNTRTFTCVYHGWTYDLDGKLVGVPGLQEFYNGALEREKWGLVKAAKVDSYKGFIFATMDAGAPPLEEYLGPVGRMGLSMVSAHGDVVVVDGVQKNRIACNWKLAVDNLFDWYHPPVTHASALATGYTGKVPWSAMDQIVSLGEYGHAISGPRVDREMRDVVAREIASGEMRVEDEAWRDTPKAQEELGELGADQRGHPNIFPNLWIASSGTQLCLRLPRGPESTEIWWFTIVDRDLPAKQRDLVVSRSNHFFGPAGLFEQDDGENWEQATRACRGVVSRRYPLNFSMNLGEGEIQHDPSGVAYVRTHVNEHAQLWTYRAWAEWMEAESWGDLKRHHSLPVGTV